MNILIAEDQHFLQMIHQAMMESWGFTCDIAPNGAEAVRLAREKMGYYNFCIMDVSMPIMNGIEATKEIRNTAKYFPILGYSANFESRDHCLNAGMDDFILKPCAPDTLLSKIRSLSVKLYRVITKQNSTEFTEEMPVDKKHADELRALSAQGLCKMNIRGIGDHDLTVIVHENVPYKISNDFIGNNEEVSVFLDRSPDKPSECHLYKSSFPMPAVYLSEDAFSEKLKAENELLKDCTRMVVKKNPE